MILIQLICYSLSVLLVCSQNQVYGDATNQFFFSNRKHLLTAKYFRVINSKKYFRVINSFPASMMFLLRKPLKWNPILEIAAFDIFSFSAREHLSAERREQSVYYNSYYKHCIISNQQFFQILKSWEDDKIIQFFSTVVLIQLIFNSLSVSVLLVCLQNQVYGDKTAIFFKSKAFIDRKIFSCYQLIPSINEVFVAEASMMFFVFGERTFKCWEARVSIIIQILRILS